MLIYSVTADAAICYVVCFDSNLKFTLGHIRIQGLETSCFQTKRLAGSCVLHLEIESCSCIDVYMKNYWDQECKNKVNVASIHQDIQSLILAEPWPNYLLWTMYIVCWSHSSLNIVTAVQMSVKSTSILKYCNVFTQSLLDLQNVSVL